MFPQSATYNRDSSGNKRWISASTESPPTPESNTPIGASRMLGPTDAATWISLDPQLAESANPRRRSTTGAPPAARRIRPATSALPALAGCPPIPPTARPPRPHCRSIRLRCRAHTNSGSTGFLRRRGSNTDNCPSRRIAAPLTNGLPALRHSRVDRFAGWRNCRNSRGPGPRRPQPRPGNLHRAPHDERSTRSRG